MTPNEQFLVTMRDSARASGHIHPEYAAAEAALETAGDPLPGIPQSNFGRDETYVKARNVFGQKSPAQLPAGMQTISIQTREFINGQYVMLPATWIMFSDYAQAFTYRMALLKRFSMYYPALSATTGEEFVRQVSAQWQQVTLPADNKMIFQFASGTYRWTAGRWSTGPARAHEVIQIYNAHADLLNAPTMPATEIA